MTEREKPLSGVRVVEFCQFLAGPYAGLLLSQFGADVTKVERPGVGDAYRHSGPPFIGADSVPFVAANRGKRSIVLDLHEPEDKDAAQALCAVADVVLVSGKPGSLRALGLDYQNVALSRPDIIYCTITGYGVTGPKSHMGAMDLIVQGASGLMSVTGEPDGNPVRTGVPITDYATGMYVALSCIAALHHRDQTGLGTSIDANLFATAASFGAIPLAQVQVTGSSQARTGNVHPHIAPYQVLPTADGLLTVAAASDAAWEVLCETMGSPDLASDERFQSNRNRRENIQQLVEALEPIFSLHTTEEWIERLTAAGIACGPVHGYDDLLEDDTWRQHLRLESIQQGDVNIDLPGLPVQSDGWKANTGPAPLLGEHTAEIMAEISSAASATFGSTAEHGGVKRLNE